MKSYAFVTRIKRSIDKNKKLTRFYKYRAIIISISILLSILILLTYHLDWIGVDKFVFIGLLIAIFLGRTKRYLLDWIPFVVLFLSYEFLRSFVPLITHNVNIFPLIQADRVLFGTLPTIALQQRFFSPTSIRWYDIAAFLIYFSHFTVPMFVAFIFWITDRKKYILFIVNLLFLSFLGFFIYLLYPAMPPWLAAKDGYIPHVYKVMEYVFVSLDHRTQWHFLSLYQMLLPNEIAAMPSLHAAYPWLDFLYLFTFYKWKALPFLLYAVAVWIAIVYLGEHYVIDAIVGVLLATISFIIIYGLHTLSKTKLKGKINFV